MCNAPIERTEGVILRKIPDVCNSSRDNRSSSDVSQYEDEVDREVVVECPCVFTEEHVLHLWIDRSRDRIDELKEQLPQDMFYQLLSTCKINSYDEWGWDFHESFSLDKKDVTEEAKVGADNGEPDDGSSLLQSIVDDFNPKEGDFKILRAVGRTATVNAAVVITTATHGAAGVVGFATGGVITAKRLSDGMNKHDDREVTKSLAVYCAATGASIAAQAITGALLIGLAGASLPVAGAIAFGVGCASGITAGALSEFAVDNVMDKFEETKLDLLEIFMSLIGIGRIKSDGVLGLADDTLKRESCCK